MIPVTKPFLPSKDKYQQYVDAIWERNWLTNNGPLVNELELQLKSYLDLPHVLFVGNGTLALQIAIKALELSGEVITTPFSYVATTSALVWERCTPVFVDIDPQTLNIDATKIEAAITEKTTGILATHVYGNPCDVEAIRAIADKYQLKVIYDAAHAFGVTYQDKSIFSYGDVSITSFHATKLFHTIEGGGIFPKNAELTYRCAQARNFGHRGWKDYDGVGINGKNSEFHAAMGLCNLPEVGKIIQKRKTLFSQYDKWQAQIGWERPEVTDQTVYNYAYYPVLFEDEKQLEKVKQNLENNEIFPRRYFYPLLSSLPYLSGATPCPVAESAARRVLCLPLYHTLSESTVDMICRIIIRSLKY